MQNIIKTIKYRATSIVFVALSLALLVTAPAVVQADTFYGDDYGSYDTYGGTDYGSYDTYGGGTDYGSYDTYGANDYGSYDTYGANDYGAYNTYGGTDYGAYDTYGSTDYGAYNTYGGGTDYGSYDTYGANDYGSYDTYGANDYGAYNTYGGTDYGSYSTYGNNGYASSYYPTTSYGYSSPSYGYSSGSGYGTAGYYPSYGYSGGGYGGYGGYGGGYSSNGLAYSNSNYSTNYSNTNIDNTCAGQGNCNTNVNEVASNTNNLTGSCDTSGSYNEGQTVVWRATATGGNGNYTYSWSGDATGAGSSVSRSYNSTGTKNATVRITSGGQSITRDCNVNIRNNNNNNDLSAICRVSDTRVQEGDKVTFSVEIDGGNSPYTIDWRGDVSGSDDSITKRFNNSGTYHASVRVRDDNGDTVTEDCSTVVVGNNNDNSNITLVSNGTNTPTNGTLASGVFLSDIPYTGVGENLKMILFILGMTLWSAFMAWVFLKKKAAKLGMTQREMIEKFKRDNLARKGIIA
ncbi:MAG: hypothetical protein V4509_02795 [Patescibacteria group bacterium]